MFPTKYDVYEKRKRIYSEIGSPEVETYSYQFDENGVKDLLPTGKTENIQDMIQSYADSCDINILMKRFSLGDESVLEQVQGFYADVRNFPTTYAELYQRLEDCNNMFMSLKPEVRELFNNSVSEFFSTYGTEEFNYKIKKFEDPNFDVIEKDQDVINPVV